MGTFLKKKRWKKILLALGCLLVVLFVLFSVFIVNPLESDYAGTCLDLVPGNSQVVCYLPNPPLLYERGLQTIAWEKFSKSPNYKQFKASILYEELARSLQLEQIKAQQQQILKDLGVDILDIAHLWEIAGREVVACLRSSPDRADEILVLTRVSFWVKLAEGLSRYVIPKKIRQKFEIKWGDNVGSAVVPGVGTICWLRHSDVMLLSNSPVFLEDAKRLIQNSALSLYSTSQSLREQVGLLRKENQDGLGYFVSGGIAKSPQDGRFLGSSLARLSLQKGVQVDWEVKLNPDVMYEIRRLQPTKILSNGSSCLPANTFAYGIFSFEPAKLWNTLEQSVSPATQREINNYLAKLNRESGSADYIEQLLAKYLEHEVMVAVSQTDFVQENLNPLDPYPAVTLFCKSAQPVECFQYLEATLEKVRRAVVAEQMGDRNDFTFFYREEYGSHPFIRIKYPDASGGAVQPAFGVVGDYVVLTTHVSQLRCVFDVADQLAKPMQVLRSYQELEKMMKEPHVGKIWLAGDGILKVAETFRQPLWDIWARHARLTSGRRDRYFAAWNAILDSLKVCDYGAAAWMDAESEKMDGKIVVLGEFKQ